MSWTPITKARRIVQDNGGLAVEVTLTVPFVGRESGTHHIDVTGKAPIYRMDRASVEAGFLAADRAARLLAQQLQDANPDYLDPPRYDTKEPANA